MAFPRGSDEMEAVAGGSARTALGGGGRTSLGTGSLAGEFHHQAIERAAATRMEIPKTGMDFVMTSCFRIPDVNLSLRVDRHSPLVEASDFAPWNLLP